MTTPTFDTIEAQASYGIGLQVGQQLSESGLEGLLPEALVAGIADALEGKQPAVPVDVVHRALREIHERADAVRRARFEEMAAEGVKYLEENREREGVNSTESGLEGLLPEALVAGIADALEGKQPAVPVDVVHRALREIHERADAVRRARFEEMAAEGVKYLEENREREGVNSTESGLQFRVINQGDGAIPARTDHVRVHYTGKLIDGTVFDSSVARGEPAEFPVNGVIAGWIEALTLMPVGSKWELTIPHNLAYGERGAGASIPPFSTLVFEVELLEIL